jgi:hypothetical protein
MDDPIACSLTVAERSERSERSERAERERWIAELGARWLRFREPLPDGVRLVFALDPVPEREVRALVAAEAQCCPFLGFRLGQAGDALVLEVTGPKEAQPIIDELFA